MLNPEYNIPELFICEQSLIGENRSYFQEEPGALRHEHESHKGGDGRQGTDQHKHPPAVELELRPHAEAPAWNTTHNIQPQSLSRSRAPAWNTTQHNTIQPPHNHHPLSVSRL